MGNGDGLRWTELRSRLLEGGSAGDGKHGRFSIGFVFAIQEKKGRIRARRAVRVDADSVKTQEAGQRRKLQASTSAFRSLNSRMPAWAALMPRHNHVMVPGRIRRKSIASTRDGHHQSQSAPSRTTPHSLPNLSVVALLTTLASGAQLPHPLLRLAPALFSTPQPPHRASADHSTSHGRRRDCHFGCGSRHCR